MKPQVPWKHALKSGIKRQLDAQGYCLLNQVHLFMILERNLKYMILKLKGEQPLP